MSAADLAGTALEIASRFVAEQWPFLVGVAAALALRRAGLPPVGWAASRRPGWAAASIFVLSLASSIAAAALHGTPLPQHHDDYGYLLAADTFAHGRLANPPHPLADHFETMHVLQRPTYAAKFPPGQGAVLALGQVLFGRPLIAVWLLVAATCVAMWWALRVWLSPSLALLGGVAAAIHPTMLSWSESYHGGALAALAGALLLGCAGVLGQRPSRRAAVVAGLAVALFAYSRPYEGLVFCVAMLVVLLIERPPLLRIAPLGIAAAVVGLVPLAIYNRAVTGSPFVLPYSIYEARYDPTPNFVWQSPRRVPPEPNLEMATVYRVTYAGHWRRTHQPGGMVDEIGKKIDVIATAVFGPRALPGMRLLMLVPLLVLPRALRQRRARLLALALLLFAFAPFSIIWWMQTHYLAPAAAVVAALMTLLLGEMWRAGAPALRWLSVAAVLAFALNAGANWIGYVRSREGGYEAARREIARSLEAEGGTHVVLVAPEVFDFVYNGAAIDAQRVVWARELGPARDAALRAYYRERRFWIIDGSSGRARPRPLP